ncbi:hypothetical protein DBV15_09210, partial [Temnothorax longispinosus]
QSVLHDNYNNTETLKRSKLWNYFEELNPSLPRLADDSMDPSAHRQSQDTSGLLVQSFIKETTEKTDALNEPSTSSLADDSMDPSAHCQSQDTSGLLVQSFIKKRQKKQTHLMNQALQLQRVLIRILLLNVKAKNHLVCPLNHLNKREKKQAHLINQALQV